MRHTNIAFYSTYSTCWRGPLLVHGNYESSLVYFCVYMKDTVCSSLCRSELLNSSSFKKKYKCSSCPIIYHENRQCCLFQLHMRQNAIFHDILCLLNTFSSACFQVWFWYQLYGPVRNIDPILRIYACFSLFLSYWIFPYTTLFRSEDVFKGHSISWKILFCLMCSWKRQHCLFSW